MHNEIHSVVIIIKDRLSKSERERQDYDVSAIKQEITNPMRYVTPFFFLFFL